MYQKGFIPIILMLGILIITIGVIGTYLYFKQNPGFSSTIIPTSKSNKQLRFAEGQEATISGTVTENNMKRLPVDGEAYLNVQTDKGMVKVVYHPGEAECPNRETLDFGLTLKQGDKVEAFGKYTQGAIRTCASTQYYIHKLNSLDQNQQTINWPSPQTLCPNVQWEVTTSGNVVKTIKSDPTTGVRVVLVSGFEVKSKLYSNPGAIPDNCLQKISDYLTNNGWRYDERLVSQGSQGTETAYIKGNHNFQLAIFSPANPQGAGLLGTQIIIHYN